MENSLLKLVLHEYEEKRARAAEQAEKRKKDLLAVNPRLQEIENEISSLSIQTAKAMLNSNPKEQNSLLTQLKKKTNSLIKEKNDFLKNLSKENNYLNPHFDCKLCKDTGYVQKDGTSQMCSCLKQRIFDIAYNKEHLDTLEAYYISKFNSYNNGYNNTRGNIF